MNKAEATYVGAVLSALTTHDVTVKSARGRGKAKIKAEAQRLFSEATDAALEALTAATKPSIHLAPITEPAYSEWRMAVGV